MKFKKSVQKMARNMLLWRLRNSQIKHIDQLNAKLIERGVFNRYPFDNVPPLISKYRFYRKFDLKWLDFYYSIHGTADPNLLSVPVYYFIETCLNHRLLTYALKEKNFYNKFMSEIPTPATYLRCINGIYYDDKFNKVSNKDIMTMLNSYTKVILKPTVESGGGSSIKVFEGSSGKLKSDDVELTPTFLEDYMKDFIIQEFVNQEKFFEQFNPTSNNTVRVFTYRSIVDDSVNILHCLIRIGAKGSFLDHDHLGGMVLAINEQNRVSQHAIDIFGNKFNSANEIIFSSLGEVPAMQEIRALSQRIAGDIHYGRLLALDFTVNTEGEPLLLEINCWRNGINQYQMHNGGLFKNFTHEILEHCQNLTPHFVLTF